MIGKMNKDNTPDVPVSGVGIALNHCLIKFDSGSNTATVSPNAEDPEKYSIKVNGQPIIAETQKLEHGDRILVGNHHYWLYCDPQINKDEMVEWESAMKEANADKLKMIDQDNEELAKIKEHAEAMRLEKEAKEKEMAEKMAEFEEQRQKQEEELEAKRQEMMQGQSEAAKKEMEQQLQREKEMLELEL